MTKFLEQLLDKGPPYASITRYPNSAEQAVALKEKYPEFSDGLDEYLAKTNDKTLICQFTVYVTDTDRHTYLFVLDEHHQPADRIFEMVTARMRKYNLIPEDATKDVALECLAIAVVGLGHRQTLKEQRSPPPKNWLISCPPEAVKAVMPYLAALKASEATSRFIAGNFRLYEETMSLIPDDFFVLEEATDGSA